jgi:hypothetical protein
MTKWIVIIIIALIVVADIVLIAIGQESFSNEIYVKTKEYKVFMAAGLILIGHLFWPNNPRCPDCKKKIE